MKRFALVALVTGVLFGGSAAPAGAQSVEEEVTLVVDALFDALDRRGLGRHLDAQRVGQNFARKARDVAWHRCRKQQ